MLDDVEEEELNPMNIQVNPWLSKPAQEESYRIQLQKIHDRIDEKNHRPEGILHYKNESEYFYCMDGIKR